MINKDIIDALKVGPTDTNNESWTPHSKFNINHWDGYLAVQKSSLTNMWNLDVVVELAWQLADVDMDRDDVLYIIKNYDKLKKYCGYGMVGV
jgi:phosphoglucomutase